jgi:hypothetical protein
MSQIFRSNAKNQNSDAKTQKSGEQYWASDAVDRIARRTPALFKTNPVPSVQTRSFTHAQSEGAS